MKALSVAIQQNLDLFSHKPRLSEVAPQIPHAPPYKRGDYVKWFEWEVKWITTTVRRGGKLREVRKTIQACEERRGRILATSEKAPGYGWHVLRDNGERTYLYSVEMKMWKRPSREHNYHGNGV